MKAFILCLLLSVLYTCQGQTDTMSNNIITGWANVYKYGDVNEGDCGFYLVLKDSLYKAINLHNKYEINNLKIYVKMELLGKNFLCGDIPKPPYQRVLKEVKILEIRKE